MIVTDAYCIKGTGRAEDREMNLDRSSLDVIYIYLSIATLKILMVGKCANPECSAEFRYLREGSSVKGGVKLDHWGGVKVDQRSWQEIRDCRGGGRLERRLASFRRGKEKSHL